MTAPTASPSPRETLPGRRTSQPIQRCDIVMKGGITSGIVYPQAVARLAEVYTFKNIGGTSAGAIAAVAAAAAEYGYRNGNTGAFERLAKVPGELGERAQGKNSRLLQLFQPQPGTRWILAALLAFLRDPARWIGFKLLGALWAVCAAFPVRTLLALGLGVAFIGLPLCFGAWQGVFPMIGFFVALGALRLARTPISEMGSAWKSIAAAALALLLILPALSLGPAGTWFTALSALGGALAFLFVFGVLVLWKAAMAADRAIADNDCGVCTGMTGDFGEGKTPLTVWMADIFDELGGHSAQRADAARQSPVTFGDLWGTPDPKAERRVNLVTMTANLNQGRPYSLPFSAPDDKRFWFDAREFARLFPERIVQWMIAHPNTALAQTAAAVRASHPHLHPLPAPADLPIVVAARMSMSFPVLLSAVPLYDYRGEGKAPAAQHEFQKCWFSDGGMCSNLPVHLFDGVLPRWPTFAINLRYFKTGDPDLATRVWLPTHNGKGLQEFRHAFAPEGPKSFVLGLINAIKNAMQNWVDNSQVRMPGYRDRVAHIHLDEHQGGMNLNMEKKLIDDIAGYGVQAADLFIKHFAPGSTVRTNWDNHRWVRFRSGMAMLEEKLFMAARALEPDTEQPGFESYVRLIERCSGRPKPAYPWANDDTKDAALGILDQLRTLIVGWRKSGVALREKTTVLEGQSEIFLDNAPRPQGYYRVMPRF
jgi:predicted acylesterase/phospholipase RssA